MKSYVLSEKLGGGTLKETTLWTNSAVTSNFAGQVVTISADMNNYKYLKFTYRTSTTNAKEMAIICSVEDLKKSVNDLGVASVQALMGGFDSSSTYARPIRYKTDTTIEIGNASRLQYNAQGNNVAIPLQIIGLS